MKRFDDVAVVGMPVYLLVAIVISCFVFGFFAVSIYRMNEEAQTNAVRAELEKITSEAENMFEYANDGSLVTVKVNLPDSLGFVVFGSLPEGGGVRPVDKNLDERVSNCYYFVMDDGTICTYSSIARFSGENVDEIALLEPGCYDVRIELENVGGKTYVKIYPE